MTEISKRAQKTLELIKKGRFYMDYDPNLPATIQELLDAKLIQRGARATTFVAAFVPVEGYIPMRDEQFAGGWGYSEAVVEDAAPDLLAALKGLVSDLEMRAVKGVVNCSDGVYTTAVELIAKIESQTK